MATTPNLFNYFFGETGLVGFSNPILETLNIGTTGINFDFSSPIVEQLNLNQQAGLSNPLLNYNGSPVLLMGVDPTTGVFRPLTSADPLVRTNGSPAFATGIFGVTGIQGFTGIALQGSTGINGATGLAGTTGIIGLSGFTGVLGQRGSTGMLGPGGIQGATGLTGNIGLSAQGGRSFFGTTGIQGQTGFSGATGVSAQGTTGLGGFAFDQGPTGVQGITGNSSASQGLTGLQGLAGNTGVQGLTGLIQQGASQSLKTLNIQTSPSSTLQYTIPGGTLSVNGNNLDIIACGAFTANTSNTLQVTFGGTTLFSDTNIFAEVTPAFYLKGRIFRNSGTEQLCFIEVISSNSYKAVTRTVTTHTLTSSLVWSINAGTGTVDVLAVRLVS